MKNLESPGMQTLSLSPPKGERPARQRENTIDQKETRNLAGSASAPVPFKNSLLGRSSE